MIVHLTCNNFSYFALNPCSSSSQLSKNDQAKTWFAIISLTFATLGLVFLICKIVYHIRKKEIDASLLPARVDQVAQEVVAPQAAPKTLREKINAWFQAQDLNGNPAKEVFEKFRKKLNQSIDAFNPIRKTGSFIIDVVAGDFSQKIQIADVPLNEIPLIPSLEDLKLHLPQNLENYSIEIKLIGEKDENTDIEVTAKLIKRAEDGFEGDYGPRFELTDKNEPEGGRNYF